jgi:uncharacterized protein YutE (UPF0331/DUF86 family)
MARHQTLARTEITKLRKSLDDVISRADNVVELELRADMARYACLRLTGFLEQALITSATQLVKTQSSGSPQTFALSHLQKSFNPRSEAILKHVERFKTEWRDEFEQLLSEDEGSQHLNSLVGIRNQIAHGQSQGVSIERVKEYRKTVDEVVNFLLDRFAP